MAAHNRGSGVGGGADAVLRSAPTPPPRADAHFRTTSRARGFCSGEQRLGFLLPAPCWLSQSPVKQEGNEGRVPSITRPEEEGQRQDKNLKVLTSVSAPGIMNELRFCSQFLEEIVTLSLPSPHPF